MPQLLLELFSEEIPARMQGQAARDVARMAGDKLKAAGLSPESLTAYAGPRRLTLVAEGLPAAQGDLSEELKGPRVGAPPQAMDGFLRKTGLSQDQLTERDGVYYAVIKRNGRPTAEIIAEMVDEIVRAFPWPKSMTWGYGTLRWVRPLKRILCLFDGAVVPFEIDGIASGDIVEGHRFMGKSGPFRVRDFANYEDALAAHYVVLDAAERRAAILGKAKALCQVRGLELVEDDGLLDEVSGLAEWPTPILGDMDPAFLDLPAEVIRTSMRTHQKYFAVRDPATGGLAPHFVVVANIEGSDGGGAIAAGNARVLSARLNDARFFWDEDNKAGNFERWLDKLNGVTFHAKLGTMAQRVERIAALAREIAPLLGADPTVAETAARLAKADLASGMVGEFPELQGLMGGYYARAAGMNGAVADAIRDHYRPQGPSDAVPTAPVSVAAALADKLDTLVGFFAIDEKPTGSKDPYALRRAALGVIRLLVENQIRAPLGKMFDQALAAAFESEGGWASRELSAHLKREGVVTAANAGNEGSAQAQLLRGESRGTSEEDEFFDGQREMELDSFKQALFPALAAFFADRLKVTFKEQGKRHDLVDAVFALGDDDLVRIGAKVEALSAFLATEDGANLLAGYKRASNILKAEEKKGALPAGDPSRAAQPNEEAALYDALADLTGPLGAALTAEDFTAAMAVLAQLRAPVDAFFEAVLVNDPNLAVRDNRLKLLLSVREAMNRVADFGLVSG